MRIAHVDFEQAGMLHPITRAYLKQDQSIRAFYEFAPTFQGLEHALIKRKAHPVDRNTLVDALLKQYDGISVSGNIKEAIQELKQEQTFTIVTGHQLNLFTGPLYFIYKIASVIQLAKQLEEAHPGCKIIPVYWMATEDHDFDEINHFHLADKTIRWDSNQTGAVGRFSIEELQPILEKLEQEIESPFESSVWKPFLDAYRKGENLTQATRILVHQLFKGEKLICIDGDDQALKAQFAPVVEKELVHSISQPLIEEVLIQWETLGYSSQVNGRAINLFYLKDQLRERIIKTETGFEVLNSTIRFTEAEIKEELVNFPERFSPNVVLRPVYQETILPNLAYIGGGAEVAYWLQLKQVFDELGVFYPQVMLRDSFVFLNSSATKKLNQLGYELIELFADRDDLLKRHVVSESDIPDFFESKRVDLKHMADEVTARLQQSDSTLERTALASAKKQFNELDKLEKKLIRSEKRKATTIANRIDAVQDQLTPNGKLQERYWNFIALQKQLGDDSLVNFVLKKADPYQSQLKVVLSD